MKYKPFAHQIVMNKGQFFDPYNTHMQLAQSTHYQQLSLETAVRIIVIFMYI